jgi:hypothetical protein
LFAEARQQSESDDAKFEARQRERRKLRDKEPDLSAASTIAGGSETTE